MKNKPELKQFGDLTAEDLIRHPVWVSCHTVDYDEPWYDDTDEETFRPWLNPVPVSPSDGMFLVRATLTFQDGTSHDGFVTPSIEPNDLGIMQPQCFLEGQRHAFWHGMFGATSEEKESFYKAAGRKIQDIFPIRFVAIPGLTDGVATGQIAGFYRRQKEVAIVET